MEGGAAGGSLDAAYILQSTASTIRSSPALGVSSLSLRLWSWGPRLASHESDLGRRVPNHNSKEV